MLENQQVVKDGNRVKVKGIFQRADTPNKNGRVYTRDLWEDILKRDEVKGMLEGRNMLGELDHPDVTETSLKNVSHIVTKLELNSKNEVIGEAEILDTPNGMILQKLIEAGVKVGISSRGYVTDDSKAKTDKNGNYLVPESFVLKTFDFVVDPSTPGAFPSTINESAKSAIIGVLESAGDNINPHIRSICESLNTHSEKGEEEMSAQKIAQLEGQLATKDNTILALENSYKTIYIEKTNLETQIEQLKSNSSKSKDAAKLENAIGIIEKLRDLVLEKENTIDQAAYAITKLQERINVVEGLLEEVVDKSKERIDLSVDVIENLRDRCIAAESIITDLSNENAVMESQLDKANSKIAVLEGAQEIENFITEKAKVMGMSEASIRKNIEGATTIEEAKDKLLSIKSLVERHKRSLPIGNAIVEGTEIDKAPKKAPANKLANAISRVH